MNATNVARAAVLAAVLGALGAPGTAASGATALGTYAWPVKGPIIRFFEQPATPYSTGHRGIDIAAPFGTPIRAPADGTITFAGWVAGSMFMTIDHGGGIKTTYSWLSGFAVSKGAAVHRDEVVAYTGHGHPEVPTPHLHFGVRANGVYVDPLLYLEGLDLVSLIRLAPLVAYGRPLRGERRPPIQWPSDPTPEWSHPATPTSKKSPTIPSVRAEGVAAGADGGLRRGRLHGIRFGERVVRLIILAAVPGETRTRGDRVHGPGCSPLPHGVAVRGPREGTGLDGSGGGG